METVSTHPAPKQRLLWCNSSLHLQRGKEVVVVGEMCCVIVVIPRTASKHITEYDRLLRPPDFGRPKC